MLVIACIPAYNEENSIGSVIQDCFKFVDKVIVCNDGSDDATSKIANQNGALVLNHPNNKGKGSSMKTLFEKVKTMNGDFIVTIDADGQFLPREIPKLLQKIQDESADIVIGYRFDSDLDMPSYRKLGNKFFDKMTNLSTKLSIRDTQSGFRIYSKKAIQQIQFSSSGFYVESEILIDAARKNLKIIEEPVTVIYNTGGRTSTKHPISHSAGLLSSLLEQIAIDHPLRYLGIPGFCLLILGIAYSIVVISIFNETRYFSLPSTLISMSSLMLGISLLLMSIVLYSISRIYKKYQI